MNVIMGRVITVLIIMFSTRIKAKQDPNLQDYADNIRQKKEEITKEQETAKKVIDEFLKEIEVSCAGNVTLQDEINARTSVLKNAILLIICSRVLGMEKGSIIDAQVKASTEWDSSYAAKNARLNLAAGRGGWRPRIDNTDQWIQVDLGENTQVAGIKTQGCAKHEEWVESFTISYSNDGTIFQPYEQNKDFQANKDQNTVVSTVLNPAIKKRYIRVYPKTWHGSICLRMELVGCHSEITCNFDLSLCGFVQDIDDKFNWAERQGSTPTKGTGPSSDHTTGKLAGKYLYIEASDPQKPGDNAKLYSPALQFSSNLCLEFYYHMFGTAIGSLNVIINEAIVFSVLGDKGDMWHKASINVSAIVGVHKIAFEGVVGSNYSGDIAIDDFSFTEGSCAYAFNASHLQANTSFDASQTQAPTWSGIECPACTNLPGWGPDKCNSDEIVRVTCPAGLDQCMSIIAETTILTQSIELKNCSNNILCDPVSDFNACKLLNATDILTSCSLACDTPGTN